MVGLIETAVQHLEPSAPDAGAKGAPQRIQRVKKLEKPIKAAVDEQVAKVYEEVDGFQARIAEIKGLIDGKQQKKQHASQEVVEVRNRLNELNSSFRSVMEEKKLIREDLDLADKMRDRMRADAKSLREKLPFVRVEQIDEEIKKLEYKMTHTSLTLQEEKKAMQQVKDLTKSRDFVRDYITRIEQITLDEASRAGFLEKIREKDQILSGLKVQQEVQRKLLFEIRERDALEAVDIPALIDERNAAFEKIKALREEVKQMRADFRAKEDEYWERERQWKEQQATQRRKDYEKREAERKEREKIRKERELENFVEPFTDEIIICDQLISYLQKHAPVVEDSPSVNPVKTEIVAPKGVGNVVISKKNRSDEELDGWFLGSAKGKGKKANKGSTATKSKEKERLSLSLDVLTSFQKVKLSPPTTVGDAPKSLDEVKLKRVEYLKLQTEAKEKRERGEEVVVPKEEHAEVIAPAVENGDEQEPDLIKPEISVVEELPEEQVEVLTEAEEVEDSPLENAIDLEVDAIGGEILAV